MPTISTKWESAGDKEYRDALKEIERGLSQTRAEAKKLAAQYEDDEDSVEALAATFQSTPPCGWRLLKFESLFGFSNNSCMVIGFLVAPSSLL